MPVWELINPSDRYTIEHERFDAAAAACILVGGGNYALEPIDEGGQICPPFLFGGFDEFAAEHFGGDMSAWLDDTSNKAAVAEALDSVLLGGPGRRADFAAACEAIDDPEKIRSFRDKWQANRSSMNDIGGRAYACAEHLRTDAEHAKTRSAR